MYQPAVFDFDVCRSGGNLNYFLVANDSVWLHVERTRYQSACVVTTATNSEQRQNFENVLVYYVSVVYLPLRVKKAFIFYQECCISVS